ncbi:hypothetical protein D7Z54_32925 [Salibacterium salarium]|uniref:Uncharacterized protein n=1 Tax=Salibacterium salarium TaxID=284579 RepID=A0A428MSK8_9BACI|nr:hypothetical protein [Salibacterium salarium]RSL29136.1 hypothetical protein D7Z54_32925 [Salibacterium salarium]
MAKFGINDLYDEPNAGNLSEYIEECRRCREETLIGVDYREYAFPAGHFIHDTTICTDCKTGLLDEEGD